ncbi:glycosyltransferase [Coleofasciculus chthonoplastes]|uniref:glycosyltransferase n=1 Tax=Coleofasciculus chthonoplastes TaxID=64178 RepID=UPI00330061E9
MDSLLKVIRKLSRINSSIRNLQLNRKIEQARQIRDSVPYNSEPNVSIIIQFFNKRQNIKQIIESLRLTTAEEIIVIDDGSIDNSYKEWLKYLNRLNEFLLHCNDLFEVRTYDIAIRMANCIPLIELISRF